VRRDLGISDFPVSRAAGWLRDLELEPVDLGGVQLAAAFDLRLVATQDFVFGHVPSREMGEAGSS
jgi:hypothetical protein